MPSEKPVSETKSEKSGPKNTKNPADSTKQPEYGGFENKQEPVQGDEWVINGRVSDF